MRSTEPVIEHDVAVPMRDGVVLRADIFRPQGAGPFPVLLYRTPYGKKQAAETYDTHLKAVSRGYAVVLQDVRGRYASEGLFDPYRNEGRDGYDTIEWAAAQSWSSGAIGTYGLSYPGAVQWLAAVESPPHLRAMVPAMTFSTPRNFFYMNGIFDLSWLPWIYLNIAPDARVRRHLPGIHDYGAAEEAWPGVADKYLSWLPLADLPYLHKAAPFYFEWLRHPPEDPWWDWAEIRGRYSDVDAAVLNLSGWYDEAYGPEGAVTNFNGLLASRTANEDSHQISAANESANGGEAANGANGDSHRMSDANEDAANEDTHRISEAPDDANANEDTHRMSDANGDTHRMSEAPDEEGPDKDTHLILGPWTHGVYATMSRQAGDIDFGPAAAINYDDLILDFFDHYLKGIENRFANGPSVRYFVMGANRWQTSATWPPAKTQTVPVYLSAADGRSLQWSETRPSQATSTFVADPAHPVIDPYDTFGPHDYGSLARRDDLLTFDSPPFADTLVVAGAIEAVIYASCDCRDFDLWVRIFDVYPDGRAINLMSPGNDVLRASYRETAAGRQLLTPGTVYELHLPNLITSNQFATGHRLRVQISASFAPHFSRNLQTGESEVVSSESQAAAITIHHSRKYPSRLLLPVTKAESGLPPSGASERTESTDTQ